jgi:hypothetical protein
MPIFTIRVLPLHIAIFEIIENINFIKKKNNTILIHFIV